MAASVADPGSFGHREMTALLNRQKFYYDKTDVFLTAASHRSFFSHVWLSNSLSDLKMGVTAGDLACSSACLRVK
jgi:hypothetical protein